jgi:hypothetical protein
MRAEKVTTMILEPNTTYAELVEMWEEEFSEDYGAWADISEARKISFAYEEGRRTGLIQVAELATELSEADRPDPEP